MHEVHLYLAVLPDGAFKGGVLGKHKLEEVAETVTRLACMFRVMISISLNILECAYFPLTATQLNKHVHHLIKSTKIDLSPTTLALCTPESSKTKGYSSEPWAHAEEK